MFDPAGKQFGAGPEPEAVAGDRGGAANAAGPLPLDRTPGEIAGMFDAIARRYDLLNHLLSAGRDRAWRARAVDALGLQGGERVLDLCTGTADLALALASPRGGAGCVVGIDFSAEMLRLGYAKTSRRRPGGTVRLLRADAERIPLCDASADGAAIGFGIRNVRDRTGALTEVRRVLRRGGRLAILEFGEPGPAPVRAVYRWYFNHLLPLVGRFASRHRSAYAYLPASVGAFPSPPAFCELLGRVGFTDVRVDPLTFGIVYLYSARAA